MAITAVALSLDPNSFELVPAKPDLHSQSGPQEDRHDYTAVTDAMLLEDNHHYAQDQTEACDEAVT